MACETTSESSVAREYTLATGRNTTALGKAAAKRAKAAIPGILVFYSGTVFVAECRRQAPAHDGSDSTIPRRSQTEALKQRPHQDDDYAIQSRPPTLYLQLPRTVSGRRAAEVRDANYAITPM